MTQTAITSKQFVTNPSNRRGKRPPGWGRFRSFRNFRELDSNYVLLYEKAIQELGNVATIYLPHRRTLFIEPEHIKYILKENHKNYTRGRDFAEMKALLGDGLITSEGDLWKRQRRLIAPEFEIQRLRTYEPIIHRAINEMSEAWSVSAKKGSERDLSQDMMKLTFQIVGEVFFGSDVVSDAERFGHNLEIKSEAAVARMVRLVKVPKSWPTAYNRLVHRAGKALDEFIFGLMERRSREPQERTDLLSRLMKARDVDTGRGMEERLIRDELMTFVSAGHETTSLAMTWTWYLLQQNREKEGQLIEELRSKVAGRIPTVSDLSLLPYNKMVIQESLRLRPPVAVFSREALEEDEIGGFYVPKGSSVSVVIWSSHRNPKYWQDPLAFEPERFLPERFFKLPPFAYYPFGGGPHICLGETFALMEAQMILGGLAQRFSIECVNPEPLETRPRITLRPKGPVRIRVRER